MMQRRIAAPLALISLLFMGAPAGADDATPAPTPAALTAGETIFVSDIAAVLKRRYPTPAAAEKAGYVRYTNEDATGAISYAGKNWDSTSEAQPSQLWYDVHGRLLGADYSAPFADRSTPPSRFGITPSRFFEENAHIHYVLKNADGTLTYSRAVGFKKYAATGLDPLHPTAAGLVKLGVAPSADAVATVFLFPHVWDVTVWAIPNPSGAFADANPDVKPSQKPNPSDMH